MDGTGRSAPPTAADLLSTGDLISLARSVRDGVFSEVTALQIAAAAEWESPGKVALEGAMTAMHLVGRSARPTDVHVLASLAFVVADVIDEPSDEDRAAWRLAALVFVLTAAEVLVDVMDIGLFRRARAIGDRLVQDVRGRKEEADILAMVGSARLSPFAFSPADESYAAQVSGWRLRLMLRDGTVTQEHELPNVTEALSDAVEVLSRAVDLLKGRERAAAQADLAYARFTQLANGLAVDRRQLEQMCHEAWPLLTGKRVAQARVLFMLWRIGGLALPPQFLIDSADLDALVRSQGLRRAATTAIVAIRLGLDEHPEKCRALRVELLARLPTDRMEAERCFLYQIGAHLLEADPLDCAQAATLTLAEPVGEGWNPRQRADAALHVLAHGEHADMAQLGSAVRALRRDGDWGHVVTVVLALRIAGWAAARAKAGEHASAAASSVRAAGLFARAGLLERALSELLSAYQAAVAGWSHAAVAALGELRLAARGLSARVAGTGAMGVLRLLYGQIFTGMSAWLTAERVQPQKEALDIFLLAMQLAKGQAFTAALTHSGPQPDGDLAAKILGLAAGIEAEAGLDRPEDLLGSHTYVELGPELYDDEAVLTSHWHAHESEDGTDLGVLVRSLRARYQKIDQTDCFARGDQGNVPYTTAQLTAALPADAVLLVFYYWGVGKPPRAGFHCLVCTNSDVRYFGVYDPRRQPIAELVTMLTPDPRGGLPTTITFAEPAMQTAHLRRCLADDPLHGVASREALQALHDSGTHYGPVLDELTRLRATGRNHLILWPHGPQYVFPFHLLPTGGGRIVADDWTVSTIPSLESVISGTRYKASADIVAVASPTGGLRYGLPFDSAIFDQAQAVAREFGAEPLDGAVRDRFRQHAQNTRYLHIAAHGSFYHPAPLFHHIYLDDGPLYAHDILRLDLRAVELVTVSACESSLVRYDENDNLLGLPAAFLRAGASALVGALWPIDPDTALDFFTSLYRGLAAGVGKLPAFRAAQLDTRSKHPEYRDWGAFCMLGDWR